MALTLTREDFGFRLTHSSSLAGWVADVSPCLYHSWLFSPTNFRS
jgi:hypothetical protein